MPDVRRPPEAYMTYLIALAFLMASAESTAATPPAFDPTAYAFSTLSDTHQYECAASPLDFNIDSRRLKIRARVTLSGRSRPLAPSTVEFLRLWSKAFQIDDSFRNQFTHEVRVREGVLDYWLPLQGSLLQPLTGEVAPGKEVDLYLIYGGCAGTTHIFFITGFTQAKPAA